MPRACSTSSSALSGNSICPGLFTSPRTVKRRLENSSTETVTCGWTSQPSCSLALTTLAEFRRGFVLDRDRADERQVNRAVLGHAHGPIHVVLLENLDLDAVVGAQDDSWPARWPGPPVGTPDAVTSLRTVVCAGHEAIPPPKTIEQAGIPCGGHQKRKLDCRYTRLLVKEYRRQRTSRCVGAE